MEFDPIFNADIISAMGVDPNQLQNASIAGRVKTILDYYKGNPNARMEVLRVVSKRPGNPLETVWTYVQLQREKQAKLQTLDPQDFEPDVAQEIVSGHMTIAKKNRVLADIKARKESAARKQKQAAEKAEETKTKNMLNSLSEQKLDQYEQVIKEIDSYDKELSLY